jgi:DNA-binding MarR family transcriptional regulator
MRGYVAYGDRQENTEAPMNRRKESTGKPATLGAVIDETRLLFHRLKAVANELHAPDRITAGKRGVLVSLHRLGPQTVPEMARARPVSRQHIQSLVNSLSDTGYVEFIDNPAHRGSPLVRLTPAGRVLINGILRREAGPMSRVAKAVPLGDLKKTLRTLRTINAVFRSDDWKDRSNGD